MTLLTRSFPLLVIFMIQFGIPDSVLAGPERIAHLTITVPSDREIYISAGLIRWLNPELEADIKNGIPKDLFYTIVLKKRLPMWFDEDLQSITIKHTIKYDVLKEQFLVSTWDGHRKQERIARDVEQLMELISTINNVKMNLNRRLRKRHTYYISIKAEVKASRLPFYLDYLLFFIPVLELDTPWADSAPFYAIDPDRNSKKDKG